MIVARDLAFQLNLLRHGWRGTFERGYYFCSRAKNARARGAEDEKGRARVIRDFKLYKVLRYTRARWRNLFILLANSGCAPRHHKLLRIVNSEGGRGEEDIRVQRNSPDPLWLRGSASDIARRWILNSIPASDSCTARRFDLSLLWSWSHIHHDHDRPPLVLVGGSLSASFDHARLLSVEEPAPTPDDPWRW